MAAALATVLSVGFGASPVGADPGHGRGNQGSAQAAVSSGNDSHGQHAGQNGPGGTPHGAGHGQSDGPTHGAGHGRGHGHSHGQSGGDNTQGNEPAQGTGKRHQNDQHSTVSDRVPGNEGAKETPSVRVPSVTPTSPGTTAPTVTPTKPRSHKKSEATVRAPARRAVSPIATTIPPEVATAAAIGTALAPAAVSPGRAGAISGAVYGAPTRANHRHQPGPGSVLSDPFVAATGSVWQTMSLRNPVSWPLPAIFLTVAFLLLFLLMQGRLDRRDPKLARAPEHSDEETIGFD